MVVGQVFANGDIWVNGDATVFGAMVTRRQMHYNGKNVIWYKGSSEATVLFGPTIVLPDGIRMIAYSEW